jgi:rSAM/selenodomain-associated transferase 1
MAIDPAEHRVQVAVLAKAPIPGLAKTRLIPALGAPGAAQLQRRLTRQAVRTALDAGLGPVTLWCAPDARHRLFRTLHKAWGVSCLVQASGDLGERMHTAFRLHCASGPVLLIGTDCPPLSPQHLRDAAQALLNGHEAVFLPAEDGGYVLVGLRSPQPALFRDMHWSTPAVMEDTRKRARDAGIEWRELETLWDLDVPADLERLSASHAAALGLAR